MKKVWAILQLIFVLLLASGCGRSTEPSVKEDDLDSKLWDIATTANNYQLDLVDEVENIAQGEVSVDMEKIIDEIWTIQQSLDEFPLGTREQIAYIGATRAYIANTRVIHEKCSAFIADGNADDYESLLHYLEMEGQLLVNVCEKRTDYLLSIGFSQNDIKNMEG